MDEDEAICIATAAVPVTSVTSADAGSAVTDEAGGIVAALAAELRSGSVRGRTERRSARRSGRSNPIASASRSVTSNRA